MNPAGTPAFFKKSLWFTSILIAVVVATALQIARETAFNVHPDEFVHVDAFCYYENHWWPPDLNSNQLVYSPYGWSRVYDPELVYLVFGKLSKVTQMFTLPESSAGCQARARETVFVYRMFNVGLYLITLVILFSTGRKHPWSFLIGMLLVALPQVTYIYSYANSDAWGLSMSLFLFLFILTRGEALLDSWLNVAGLALLTGLVLLSKKTDWLSLPFSYLLAGWTVLKGLNLRQKSSFTRILGSSAGLLVAVLLIFAPLNIIYPLTQGDFEAKADQMREVRAAQEFKPSHPTSPGYRLAEQGFSFRRVLTDQRWIKLSAQSLYGRFGYLSVKPPLWLYRWVLILFLLLALLTCAFLVLRWEKLPATSRLMLCFAPLVLILVIIASMVHSWNFDFQPQGRYLFSALVPLALIFGGALAFEPGWLRGLRLSIWMALFVLNLYVLWFILLGDARLL